MLLMSYRGKDKLNKEQTNRQANKNACINIYNMYLCVGEMLFIIIRVSCLNKQVLVCLSSKEIASARVEVRALAVKAALLCMEAVDVRSRQELCWLELRRVSCSV